jgi:hypothetical protein
MTTTITTSALSVPERFSSTLLTTASADTEQGLWLRSLLTELLEVRVDQAFARRYVNADDWLVELEAAEQHLWRHIAEAAAAHVTAGAGEPA